MKGTKGVLKLMSVTYLNNNNQAIYGGLSTDPKPDNVTNGAIFIEIDTSAIYMFDKENKVWQEQKIKTGSVLPKYIVPKS